MTKRQKLALFINICLCLYLLITGLYLVLGPDSVNSNYYLLIAAIIAIFLSTIIWAHLFMRRLVVAKKIKNVAITLLIVAIVISGLTVMFVLNSLNNWG